MLFRTRRLPTPVGPRFRSTTDRFTFRREDEIWVAHVSANSERSVDLFHALIAHMPAAVDFAMECLRTGRHFVGDGLHLAEAQEAVGRLKVPLVVSAGVELAVYTADEQLALSSMLELWIYAKTDRWLYLLLGQGLEEVEEFEPPTWRVGRDEFTGAPELVDAVTAAAERLTLRLVPGPA